MAFLVFKCYRDAGQHLMKPTGETFRLAGRRRGLLCRAWQQQGALTNAGWHVSEENLIQLHNGQYNLATHRLIIDFAPGREQQVCLMELRDVYAYKWGDDNPDPGWTPLMLKCVRVLDDPCNAGEREEILGRVPVPVRDAPVYWEFLYLQGAQGREWSWGKNGWTNGALLYGAALNYFRPILMAEPPAPQN